MPRAGAKKKAPGALVERARKAKALALAKKEKRLASLIALIERRKDRIVEDFYDIGEALRAILREKLFEARGTTFEQLVTRDLGISRASAFRLIAIVDALRRERAIELGQEKSYALVTYASATPADDTPLGLLESGAKIGRRPIAALGANEVKRAAAKARKPKQPRVSAETQKAIRAAVTAVRSAGLPRPTTSLRGRTLTLTIRLPD